MDIQRIHEKMIQELAGPLAGSGDLKVSLFIVSAKNPRLKKLDLEHLSPAERVRKLNKWATQNRFVAVIEKGDQVFAHLNAEHAKRLQPAESITFEGKDRKVAVTSLTDEDYEQLAAVGEAFKQYVNEQNEKESSDSSKDVDSYRHEAQQFFSTHRLVSDKMQMDYLIASMQNVPSKIILNFLRRWNKDQREAAKEQKADQLKQDILQQGIKKDVLRKDIKTGVINAQQRATNATIVNRIRSE